MANGTIAVLGNLATLTLHRIAPDFGWSVETADDLDHLGEMGASRRIVAVFFEPHGSGQTWEEALSGILKAAPEALPIACHRFSETIDWPSLASAGAFHAIPLPFDDREARQSLGFVWGARLLAAKTNRPSEPRRAHAGALVA